VAVKPTREELEAAHCWETSDHVPKRPEMTGFRRRMRLHQSRWREAHGHPIGSQPLVPLAGKAWRPVGSHLPVDYARATGATFLTPSAHGAALTRLSAIGKEPHQSLDVQRTWADLLWPTGFCFNLFGDLAADFDLAGRALRRWWPDVPGTVIAVRFEHSPGRLDAAYIGNLCAFGVAFVLDLGAGTHGILGIKAAYADWNKRQPPKPERLVRYIEVSERSGTFGPKWIGAVNGTELIHVWLEHQLLHSMLQHPGGEWRWGRYVVVHPAGNTDFGEVCATYRGLLVDESTFASATVEELLGGGVFPEPMIAAFRERYLPEPDP
jgi:PD-(D/E)XK nuclease superfamily